MTLSEAKQGAKARSSKNTTIAVVKAVPGELRDGYYSEFMSTAIPPEQIVTTYLNGIELPILRD